jgi:hypothetical protein
MTPHWRNSLRSVKLVRWHQRPPGLDNGADLEPLLRNCPALRALDLSEFYCWTEDILPALAAHPTTAATLTELDLGLAGATNGFHASELIAIAGSCPNLRKLVAPCLFNPRYVDFVSDDALLSLATSCPKLMVLRLREPFELVDTSQWEDAAITVAGMIAFFAALPGLEDFMLDLRHNVLEFHAEREAFCSATSSGCCSWSEDDEAPAASPSAGAAERNGWPHGDTSERSRCSRAGKHNPGGRNWNASERGSPCSDSAVRVARSAVRSRWHASATRCRDRASVRKPRMCSRSGSGRSRRGDAPAVPAASAATPFSSSSAMRRGAERCRRRARQNLRPLFLFLFPCGDRIGRETAAGRWMPTSGIRRCYGSSAVFSLTAGCESQLYTTYLSHAQ